MYQVQNFRPRQTSTPFPAKSAVVTLLVSLLCFEPPIPLLVHPPPLAADRPVAVLLLRYNCPNARSHTDPLCNGCFSFGNSCQAIEGARARFDRFFQRRF